jgi:hypothetical protein
MKTQRPSVAEQRPMRRQAIDSHLSRIWLACLITFSAALIAGRSVAFGEQPLKPTDPIASIDGEPLFLGELNYLLVSKLGVKDLSTINIDVQQASSALLVRQHLAMKSLREQGGRNLQLLLDRQWDEFVSQLGRREQTLQQYANRFQSDPQSIRHFRDWDTAWRSYLKRSLTDTNLKRFYQRNADRFASTKWRVSHVFLPVDNQDDDIAALAKQRIQWIADQLQSGPPADLAKRFAELAATESDGSTAKDGGQIGWVSTPGDLPAAVMDAIRQTPVGAVTNPVLSPLGFHLALVHEKSSMNVPFEKVADLNRLRREAADTLFDGLVEPQSEAKTTWYIVALRPPSK